jgi:kynurenine formamidase
MTHAPARDTAKELLSYSGDGVTMYLHTGTHIDALNHFGLHGLNYLVPDYSLAWLH